MASSNAIPSGVGDITPEWLTNALRGADYHPTVTGVRAERIAHDSGFSSLLYRLHLTGDRVPATLIAKLPAQSEARGAMELLGGYRRELAFYRHVAGQVPMDVPKVYAALGGEDGADFVLLMEDLADWDNADHLVGLTMEQVRTCIAGLAGLHIWTTDDPVLQQFPSLDTPIVRDLLVPAFGPGWQVYREKSGASVSARIQRFAEYFTEFAPIALVALTERNQLLHGDIRADNLFFRGDAMKVVDFQFAARGSGAADIAYLVSQGLSTDVRCGQDETLVREYLDRLGISDYSFDDAWWHYRCATAYLMMLPVITLIGWDGLPERSRQLCLTLVDRAIATIDDIDAVAAFE